LTPYSSRRLEKTATNAILAYLRQRRAFAEKIHGGGPQRRGLPDIICCYHGHFIAIETKREGGLPEPSQIRVRDEIIVAGGIAVVAYSVDDIVDLLDRIDKAESHDC